jgi:hypothetical protein
VRWHEVLPHALGLFGQIQEADIVDTQTRLRTRLECGIFLSPDILSMGTKIEDARSYVDSTHIPLALAYNLAPVLVANAFPIVRSLLGEYAYDRLESEFMSVHSIYLSGALVDAKEEAWVSVIAGLGDSSENLEPFSPTTTDEDIRVAFADAIIDLPNL